MKTRDFMVIGPTNFHSHSAGLCVGRPSKTCFYLYVGSVFFWPIKRTISTMVSPHNELTFKTIVNNMWCAKHPIKFLSILNEVKFIIIIIKTNHKGTLLIIISDRFTINSIIADTFQYIK